MAISEYTLVHDRPSERVDVQFPALTLDMLLYGAIFSVALFLRLFVLGHAPLASSEAEQALASLRFVAGRAESFTGSPLLFAGNALLFGLLGPGDAMARALPAIFGSVLVLVPALFRRELGRGGALVASLLLAVSPSLVFFSRSVSGSVIAVTCALAAIAFTWRYLSDRMQRDLLLAAASAALALLAAREIWMIVLVVGAYVLIRLVRIRQAVASPETPDGPVPAAESKADRSDWVRAGVVFAAVFLGVGTTLFLHWEGVGAAFNLLGAWAGGLYPGGSFSDPLRLLVIYEPIPLFLGVTAMLDLAFAVRLREREGVLLHGLVFWVVGAFILYTIGSDKDPTRIVVLVVPLALIAGWYIGEWFSSVAEMIRGTEDPAQVLLTQEAPVAFFGLVVAGFVYIVMAEYVIRGSVLAADLITTVLRASPGAELNAVVMAVLLAAAVAAVAFLSATTVGWARSRNIALVLALTLLAAWTVRQNALLSFSGAWNPRELLVARAASPNLRDLVSDLESISRWRANASHSLKILVDSSLGPAVEWQLREFVNARFVSHPTMQADTQALVLPPDAQVTRSRLMSQRYQLEAMRGPGPQQNLLRWLIFRDVGPSRSLDAAFWIAQPQ